METRNVLLAIILSTIVLVFWATFFEAPIVDQTTNEKVVTKSQDSSSPSIDETEKEIKNENMSFRNIFVQIKIPVKTNAQL